MNYNLVVLVLPCRNMEEELYCNRMVVLVLPCRDVEGGALLQQDDGAVLPQHGQEEPGNKLPTAKEKIRSWPRSSTG